MIHYGDEDEETLYIGQSLVVTKCKKRIDRYVGDLQTVLSTEAIAGARRTLAAREMCGIQNRVLAEHLDPVHRSKRVAESIHYQNTSYPTGAYALLEIGEFGSQITEEGEGLTSLMEGLSIVIAG